MQKATRIIYVCRAGLLAGLACTGAVYAQSASNVVPPESERDWRWMAPQPAPIQEFLGKIDEALTGQGAAHPLNSWMKPAEAEAAGDNRPRFSLSRTLTATDGWSAGWEILSPSKVHNAWGDARTGFGGEIRIGQFSLDLASSAKPEGWFVFVSSDGKSLSWTPGSGEGLDGMQRVLLQDQLTVGDVQAGISTYAYDTQLSLSYMVRQVEFHGAGETGWSRQDGFLGVSLAKDF